jgi:hypothetical protein
LVAADTPSALQPVPTDFAAVAADTAADLRIPGAAAAAMGMLAAPDDVAVDAMLAVVPPSRVDAAAAEQAVLRGMAVVLQSPAPMLSFAVAGVKVVHRVGNFAAAAVEGHHIRRAVAVARVAVVHHTVVLSHTVQVELERLLQIADHSFAAARREHRPNFQHPTNPSLLLPTLILPALLLVRHCLLEVHHN